MHAPGKQAGQGPGAWPLSLLAGWDLEGLGEDSGKACAMEGYLAHRAGGWSLCPCLHLAASGTFSPEESFSLKNSSESASSLSGFFCCFVARGGLSAVNGTFFLEMFMLISRKLHVLIRILAGKGWSCGLCLSSHQ